MTRRPRWRFLFPFSAFLMVLWGCVPEPPRVDPFANLPHGKVQQTDLVLAIVTSQNTKNAIKYLEKNRSIASTWGTAASRDDLDAGPLVNGLSRALNQRFSRVVRVDDPDQAKSVGAHVIAVVDLYFKLGKMSFQTTQVDLKVFFTRLDSRPIETVSSVGKSTVPYPAWTFRFRQAANQALAGFVESLSDSPKLSTFLTVFARTKRHASTRAAVPPAAPPSGNVGPKPSEIKGWRSSGTGFLLRGTSYILTSYHVVQGMKRFRVSFPSGESYPGQVAANDANNDLALVRLLGMRPKRGGFVPDFGAQVQPGERVHALGYPLGTKLSRRPSIVSGAVSATTGLEDNIAQFRMTAPINEGNSGGPVVSDRGLLVGVASAGLVRSGVENVRFGTKISAAMLLLQQTRLARKFSVSVVPKSRKVMNAAEIFRKYSPYVVLIEAR